MSAYGSGFSGTARSFGPDAIKDEFKFRKKAFERMKKKRTNLSRICLYLYISSRWIDSHLLLRVQSRTKKRRWIWKDFPSVGMCHRRNGPIASWLARKPPVTPHGWSVARSTSIECTESGCQRRHGPRNQDTQGIAPRA